MSPEISSYKKKSFSVLLAFMMVASLFILSINVVHAIPLFQNQFENGIPDEWTGVTSSGGSHSVSSSWAYNGTYSLFSTLNAGGAYVEVYKTFSAVGGVCAREYVYWLSFPSANSKAYRPLSVCSASNDLAWVTIQNVNGTAQWGLTYYTEGSLQSRILEHSFPKLNTSYCIEIDYKKGVGSGS
ncbi:MAG: hypothetical protein V1850_03465, partial [Candidatus Bathyarchaeota archaeon]